MSTLMMFGNRFHGRRNDDDVVVTVNATPLDPRFDLRSHSPTGFEWGYGGSGPAQLALAILANELTDVQALDHYQQFKQEVIAALNGDEWTLGGYQIHDWLLQSVYDRPPLRLAM